MHSRRSFLGGLGAFGGMSLLHAARPRTNVLFIVSDDLSNTLSVYGDPVAKTPNVERLARRGVTFDRAYCQYPLCQPSRASFLSGLRPETTKVWTLQTPTREYIGDAVFMPELYRKNGYYSAHAGKIFHTGECCEDPRSWDFEVREYGKSPKPDEILRSSTAKGSPGHSFDWHMVKTRSEEMPDGVMARKTVEWLEQRAADGKPFFLGTGFRRPHSPYAVPKKYFDMYPPEKMRLPDTSPEDFKRILPAALNHDPPERPLTPQELRQHLSAWYACVSFVDDQLGVLLDAMDRLKLWDTTAVAFLGDHGYHLGEHGGLWHKSSLFEESARVPLIFAAPQIRAAGRQSKRLVELVDLYPTLAEICGLKAPTNLEGLSFVPLLQDPERSWKKGAFTIQGRGKERREASRDVSFLGKSVRTERFRYTEWDEGRRGVELYDHDTDPREMKNLADDPKFVQTRRELHDLLTRGWRAALPS